MEIQPYPPPGSCVAKNSQRPGSVETVQGGVPPYGVKETLVVVVKWPAEYKKINFCNKYVTCITGKLIICSFLCKKELHDYLYSY